MGPIDDDAGVELLTPWEDRRSPDRRLAVAVVVLLAAASATAAVLSGSAPSGEDDSRQPVPRPGQVVVLPSFEAYPPGPRVRGARTNQDAGHRRDAAVQVVGRIRGETLWASYCSGAPDLFWVVTVGPGPVLAGSGRCDGRLHGPPRRVSPPAVVPHEHRPTGAEVTTVRLVLTGKEPSAFRSCIGLAPPTRCEDPRPRASVPAGVRFGVVLLDLAPAPVGDTVLGQDVAKVTWWGGEVWRLTTTVTSVSGERGLLHRLAPSEEQRLVQVVPGPGRAEPVLTVDGRRVDGGKDGLAPGAASTLLRAGPGHEVTLTLPAGAPTQQVGLAVFEHDP